MENNHQIVKNVTKSYLKIFKKLDKGGLDFFSLSEEIIETTRSIGLEMYSEVIKTVDETIKDSAERKNTTYK